MKVQIWKESAVYLVATFGMTWLLWFGAYYNFFPTFVPVIMLGTAVPSVMGLIFTATYGGIAELKKLLLSALRFQAPRRWWLYATLLFPAILLCACGIFILLGGKLPPAQFLIWFLPIAFLYIFVCMGPLGEEMGWRGFLLKRLLLQGDTLKAGLGLGFIWSLWHFPLFLIPGTIQYELAKMGIGIALFGYFVYTICISQLITELYVATNENVLLCMVFHTICNLSLGVAPIILTKGGASILLFFLVLTAVFIQAKFRRNSKGKLCGKEK